jgi:hypothetical protein
MDPDEFACEAAFRRWCADELIDPRLQDVLEEAFVNGWIARAVEDGVELPPVSTRARKLALRGPQL